MNDSLLMMLRELKITAMGEHAQRVAIEAERSSWSFVQYLYHLTELEVEDRKRRRVERYLRASGLPKGKTLATLDLDRLPKTVQRKLGTLCEGNFIDAGHNVIAFGLPGRGKTHLLAALGAELVQRGYKVLFTPAYKLVQRLLAAKEALRLEKELKKLDHFDAVTIDDIGYIQQNRDEMEVLFTFLAERYERKSVLISSNLVFSQWDRIFKDPMTTAAAIDRLVHHSTILELTGPSFRTEAAKATATSDNYNADRIDSSVLLPSARRCLMKMLPDRKHVGRINEEAREYGYSEGVDRGTRRSVQGGTSYREGSDP